MDKNNRYIQLLKHQIAKYKKEKRFIEYKSNYQDATKLGRYISALSNGACLENEEYAYLYFGVEDETLEVRGTTFDSSKVKAKGNQLLEIFLRQYITPKIDFIINEFFYDNTKRIVVFVIPAAKDEPTCFMNVPYIRVDSSVTDMRPYSDWMRTIYISRTDWSKVIVEEASINDLDENAIKKARFGFAERYPDVAEELASWDDKTFLDKAKITIDGKITRTAILLLGKEESSHFLNHISQIVWKLDAEQQAGEIFSLPFLTSIDKVLGKIRNYRYKIYPSNSLIPAEIWKYDTRTILEALNNCIAHQDYRENARIIVTESNDNLTFTNHGSFFDGQYEDYIQGKKTPENYRNPFLARAMVNLKMIDTQGYGIHNMFVSQRKRYLPMPDYDLSEEGKVILKIPGNVINQNYSQLLINNSDIDLATVVLLDKIQKRVAINDDAIAMLRKKKLIEGRKNNLTISKHIAQIIDKKAEYTKNKGLNDDYYKQLVLKSLQDHNSMSRKDINELLMNKLPDVLSDEQKYRKIGNLLSSLRKTNTIKIGKKRNWILVEI
jgi:ATP-dependent DNA helicase RecG